uniref:F-box domain-containing protein n=1 Tax=Aplanochytrium stocchinoi TaxID=215587 RepID=A0A6S8F2U2_9STRA|mmetsp:Transcript_11863/g.13745  ORF Transcript_11863/g.13745 Transcript_11863/m.13745 type:complete len:461 (+) Transcript_11863:74-1456(+)|eukprot:CAMPEP_0204828416 /NCGR_PEP_ID=MMETSP1346-20131115/6165_1 /ASSEMBLY_ACC=CAM_ASM_000771 /TAXON_ID=215587 /ORGANISM="Aplanochytrium stocchinoi, Strain GSBS06" /LENGTH=460 /DNA_ID=CAMNT_0051957465 /DNA_START=46 /DNA_END=1428 /DNA_ORIENTATION=+
MLGDVPDNIFSQLVGWLRVEDVLNLTSTCKYIYNFGKVPLLWRHLLEVNDPKRLRALDSEANVAVVKRACIQASHVWKLDSLAWGSPYIPEDPESREGHLMVCFGENLIVLTGGFCNDQGIYFLDLKRNVGWERALPAERDCASFAYGASLTVLDKRNAIRFGGFQGGGYTHQCDDLFLFTYEERDNAVPAVRWRKITPRGRIPQGRAYHTATLISNRYLLIIGGMTTDSSILSEAVLDVQTWTWLDVNVSLSSNPSPSERHGHSIIFDEAKKRLVLFGGGNGSDLLRSGIDNSEVWELCLGESWSTDIVASFPWTWRMIHGSDDNSTLAPQEKFCIGRCHIGVLASPHKALFCFGGGSPLSSAGAIIYDLRSDEWEKADIKGYRPQARFTAAGVVAMDWLVVQGGFSVRLGMALPDTIALDLANSLKRELHFFPSTNIITAADIRRTMTNDVNYSNWMM